MATTKMKSKFSSILFLLFLIFNSFVIIANSEHINTDVLFDKVLNHFSKNYNTNLKLDSWKIIEAHYKGDTNHFLVEIDLLHSDVKHDLLICQLILKHEDLEKINCESKEEVVVLPIYNKGFLSKKPNQMIKDLFNEGIKSSNVDPKRLTSTTKILAVKKLDPSTMYITGRISRAQDSQYETCEMKASVENGKDHKLNLIQSRFDCYPYYLPDDKEFERKHLTSDELADIARWTMLKINENTPFRFNYTLNEIIKTNVVKTPGSRGTLTSMQISLGVSPCSKVNYDPDVEWDCDSSGEPIICYLSIWQRPWKNDRLLSQLNCKLIKYPFFGREKRSTDKEAEKTTGFCTGCLEDVNIDDNSKVNELANLALQQSSFNAYKLVKVNSAQREVINGVRYLLNVDLAECNDKLSNCDKESLKATLRCRFEITEGSVDKVRNTTSSECEPINQSIDNVNNQASSSNADDVQTHIDPNEGLTQKGQLEQVPTDQQISSADLLNRKTKRRENSLGAPVVVDLEKEGELINQLATMALNSIDDIDDDSSTRKLIQVFSAKKQTVNGVIYEISMKIGVLPPCKENCLKEELLPSLKCKVWVHTNQGQQPRVIKSECEPEMEDFVEIEAAPEKPTLTTEKQRPETTPSNHRSKRSSGRRHHQLVGGLSEADKNDPIIQEIAQFAVQELDKSSNSLYKRQVVEVRKAQTQVVAGTMYHLELELAESDCQKNTPSTSVCSIKDNDSEICSIKVWDRPWLQDRRVDDVKCGPQLKRSKRHTLHGGRTSIDTDDPFVQENIPFVLNELNKDSTNQVYKKEITSVIKAERQIVSGTLLHLTIETAYNNCTISSNEPQQLCIVQDNADREICDVKIHEQKWKNYKAIKSLNCNPSGTIRTKRSYKFLLRGIHDHVTHGSHHGSIGGDDHDLRPHGSHHSPIGGDDHDLRPHGSHHSPIGGDDHDLRPHGSHHSLIGGDDHDIRPHGSHSNLLGRGSHDLLPHGGSHHSQIGGGTHDLLPHGSHDGLIGGKDSHDFHFGLFKSFMKKHKKVYTSQKEMKKRFKIFRENLKTIKLLQENEQGTAKYGPTQFADLTREEFKKNYLGLKPELLGTGKMKLQKAVIPAVNPLPEEVDWRKFGAVTPVKNQGMCGSCWAFSVTGNIEGQWKLRRGKLLSLSEQELVDCDSLDNGCNGGLPLNAYESIKELGGLESENDYPYEGRNEKCHYNKTEVRVTVSGALNISTHEDSMAIWLSKYGPISIGINANAMQFYFGGVSHPFKMLCDPKDLDHGVLIVGYGVHTTRFTQRKFPYWIVKNSWGPHWGEKGYYRVYRGDGTCGVNLMATSAVVG